MIAMRAQLAPALLLLLVLLAAATPLVPALTPEEIRDRKINGANKLYIMSANPEAYAGEKKPMPESKKEAPKDVVQKTSYVMDAGAEPKPESKKDEKVLEAKIGAEVKAMRKEAAYDDAVAEKNAKEFKSKPKNTTDDAEDQAKEVKSKSKGDSSEDDSLEKKSKSKVDYSSEDADGEKEKKSKNKDDDSAEKKSKSKSESSEDIDDEKKEKKSKSKDEDDDDDDDDDDKKKKEKKSMSKEEDSTDDSEKKSKIKSGAYKLPAGAEKKSKEKSEYSEDAEDKKKSKEKSESSEEAGDKKKSKSKNKEEDFDAVPIESKADESVPVADTPESYQAPTKKTPPRLPAANGYQAPTTTMSAADTPDGYLPPKKAEPKMSAADTPDGYAAPTTMSAADTPDGYVPSSKAQPAMSATDSPDGYVPSSKAQPAMSSTDSPDGYVPASDSPDGYAAPSTKPKLNVQSFAEMAPQSVLQMLSPTVRSLCAKTSFPYTCTTSIAKLPETTVVPGRQKDGLGVLTLAVDAVRAKIAEAKNAAKELAMDPRTDKISKGAISDCLQMYDDIKTSYDTTMAALKRGDRPTATSNLDAARTYVDTCDQGFLDRPALKPVMVDQDKVLAQLSSNVLAINRYI